VQADGAIIRPWRWILWMTPPFGIRTSTYQWIRIGPLASSSLHWAQARIVLLVVMVVVMMMVVAGSFADCWELVMSRRGDEHLLARLTNLLYACVVRSRNTRWLFRNEHRHIFQWLPVRGHFLTSFIRVGLSICLSVPIAPKGGR
jgi:hypothetical protein